MLLDAEWLVSARAYPRDFALISDTAIWNVGLVLPSYRAALLSHAGNRAFLYLVGDGWLCKQCEQPYVEDEEYRCGKCPESTREVVDALMTAGFELHEIRPAGVGESGIP